MADVVKFALFRLLLLWTPSELRASVASDTGLWLRPPVKNSSPTSPIACAAVASAQVPLFAGSDDAASCAGSPGALIVGTDDPAAFERAAISPSSDWTFRSDRPRKAPAWIFTLPSRKGETALPSTTAAITFPAFFQDQGTSRLHFSAPQVLLCWSLRIVCRCSPNSLAPPSLHLIPG